MAIHLRIQSWALIFILRLHFQPKKSIAQIITLAWKHRFSRQTLPCSPTEPTRLNHRFQDLGVISPGLGIKLPLSNNYRRWLIRRRIKKQQNIKKQWNHALINTLMSTNKRLKHEWTMEHPNMLMTHAHTKYYADKWWLNAPKIIKPLHDLPSWEANFDLKPLTSSSLCSWFKVYLRSMGRDFNIVLIRLFWPFNA